MSLRAEFYLCPKEGLEYLINHKIDDFIVVYQDLLEESPEDFDYEVLSIAKEIMVNPNFNNFTVDEYYSGAHNFISEFCHEYAIPTIWRSNERLFNEATDTMHPVNKYQCCEEWIKNNNCSEYLYKMWKLLFSGRGIGNLSNEIIHYEWSGVSFWTLEEIGFILPELEAIALSDKNERKGFNYFECVCDACKIAIEKQKTLIVLMA